jgi:hypothetical protein
VLYVFYAVRDEERVMLYQWPLYVDPVVLSEALAIVMRYLIVTGHVARRAELRQDAAHAMIVAWRSGVRHKIQLANCGIAAVEKAASEEVPLSSYSGAG